MTGQFSDKGTIVLSDGEQALNATMPFGQSSLERFRANRLDGQTIRIIENPSDWGKPSIGAQDGPEYLRTTGGLERHLSEAGATIVNRSVPVSRREATDTTTPDSAAHVRNLEHILTSGRNGATEVEEALRAGEKVLALRGDHSAALDLAGALKAFPDPKNPEFSLLKIIWIDTHPDINGVSDSLNAHGKMVRTLLGEGHPDLAPLMEGVPKLRPENIIYIGLNQPDNDEIETLKKLHINCFTSDDLEDSKSEMYQTINRFVSSGAPCWLEFDQDSMCDSVSQGTFMPNGNEGLTSREVYSIARRFHYGGNGVGVGIAELVPELDSDGQSAQIAAGIASRALGAGNPLYHHGGYDSSEDKRALSERDEIQNSIRELESQMQAGNSEIRSLGDSVHGQRRMDRRAFLGIAAVMGATKFAADLVNSRQRPLLLDDAVFQGAVSDFEQAKKAGNFERLEQASSTMQSMVHLSLHAAGRDDGLRTGIWNAVRQKLGDDFESFEQRFKTRYPYD